MALRLMYITNTALPNLALTDYLMLNEKIEICGLLVEDHKRINQLNQLMRKKSFLKKLDIAAFRFLHRFLPDYEYRYAFSGNCRPDIPFLKVEDINNRKVIDFIDGNNPEMLLIKGVSVIQKDILDAIDKDVVNIHSGWLPDYRGVQCGTWPLVNNEFEKLGVSFHYVDSGLDTGKIILRKKIGPLFLTQCNILQVHNEIGFRQYRLILDSLDQFIDQYSKGLQDLGYDPEFENRPYSYLGLSDYLTAIRNVFKHRKEMGTAQ